MLYFSIKIKINNWEIIVNGKEKGKTKPKYISGGSLYKARVIKSPISYCV